MQLNNRSGDRPRLLLRENCCNFCKGIAHHGTGYLDYSFSDTIVEPKRRRVVLAICRSPLVTAGQTRSDPVKSRRSEPPDVALRHGVTVDQELRCSAEPILFLELETERV